MAIFPLVMGIALMGLKKTTALLRLMVLLIRQETLLVLRWIWILGHLCFTRMAALKAKALGICCLVRHRRHIAATAG